jgi:hypothetical protein
MVDKGGTPIAELAFNLEYDGPALASHDMDVRQLAPALFALGELFQEMNRIQYPSNPDVAVRVHARRDGSIDVHLLLVAGVGLLSSPEANALANLTHLLGGFKKLVDFIKVRAGRQIEKVEPTPSGQLRLSMDGVEVEIDQTTKAFEENPTIRHRLREVVSPVAEEGIEVVRLVEQELSIGIDKSEAPLFLEPAPPVPAESEELTNEVRKMVLRVLSPWFKKGNKWKVTDGATEFWVSVLDEDYVADVLAARIAVTPQDVLECRVRVVQTLDIVGTLHTEYELVEVVEHHQRPQGRLLDEGS